LLPKSPDGFAALETSLSTERLGNLMAGMREQEVQVYFPRFKMETSFELSETLQAMGMADAFTPKANFMKMIEYAGQPQGAAPIWIDSVLHKAFVDVNEEGTEAAAATAVIMTRALEMHETFRADHPFLFLIRDNATGSILFLGRVMSP
jgi:serpin B